MKVKMYRHTLRYREHLPDGTYVDFYDTGTWSSVQGLIPPKDKELVLIEKKEIEVAESCLRRSK